MQISLWWMYYNMSPVHCFSKLTCVPRYQCVRCALITLFFKKYVTNHTSISSTLSFVCLLFFWLVGIHAIFERMRLLYTDSVQWNVKKESNLYTMSKRTRTMSWADVHHTLCWHNVSLSAINAWRRMKGDKRII